MLRRGLILACLLLAAAAPAAHAQRLLGGAQQAAVSRAFFSEHGHRGDLIVSARASTVASAWRVARWVIPTPAGGSDTRQGNARVHAAYFHLAAGGLRPGQPPARVLRDLSAPLRVSVLYTGSGSEQVTYSRTYQSVCQGGGGFVEQESDQLAPMRWRVLYTVDLDRVLSAVRGPSGTEIVPDVSFDPRGSNLQAIEHRHRTYVDNGCFSAPTGYSCTTTWHLLGGGGANALDLTAGNGPEVGIPLRSTAKGSCSPESFTLGPSQWAQGGATALVRAIRLAGGRLPGNPYAPLRVRWPGNAAGVRDGSVNSPCAGAAGACRDRFSWRGTVRLQSPGFG